MFCNIVVDLIFAAMFKTRQVDCLPFEKVQITQVVLK
jgi:hypothetical protein